MAKSKAKTSRKKLQPATVPVVGNLHNAAFYLAIGGLVINWSNNESVFRAILQALVGGNHIMAAIIWRSSPATEARLRLLWRMCRARLKNKAMLRDIESAIIEFRGYSKVRNFYCHATYENDNDGNIISASSATTPDDGAPIKTETRKMTKARLNEITSATLKLVKLNRKIWLIVERLHAELELPPVKMHPLLRASLDNQ